MSVTSFTHVFFPGFDGPTIAQNTLQSKTFAAKRDKPTYKYYGCKTVADIMAVWNKSRDLGTMLHDNIENYLNGVPYTLVPDNVSSFECLKALQSDHDFWRWTDYRTEWAVFDEETQIAGKIDYCGKYKGTDDLVILDWKRVLNISDASFSRFTGKGAEMGYEECAHLESCNFVKYSLQLNVYRWLLQKNYNVKVRDMFLIQLHPTLKSAVVYRVPTMQAQVGRMMARRIEALDRVRCVTGVANVAEACVAKQGVAEACVVKQGVAEACVLEPLGV
jgi:hypothetical protein